MLGLAFGYFLWYTAFAAFAKALSSGLVPGVDEQVGGLVLLSAAALGFLAGALLFLALSGWWHHMDRGATLGRSLRLPGGAMVGAGLFMAVIVATTILNFTFVGVSILFMLLLMRAGVLGLAPINDAVWGRKVRGYSWAALALCLVAVAVALGDVDGYQLTFAAILSLCAYLLGYVGRFQIMSRTAKTGEDRVDRRYLVEENLSAAVWLVGLCAALALLGVGQWGQSLREGFTDFLFSEAAIFAFAIGLLYQALYVFGTLIYLDPRAYSWCVPANRSASVFSAIVASFGLAWLAGIEAPGTPQLVAAFFVLLAVAALSYPQWRDLLRRVPEPVSAARPVILFVCGGNTGRSPIAAAVTRAELARSGNLADAWSVACAGVSVHSPGAAMATAATAALRRLGVAPIAHAAQPLTPELCERSAVIYCMTIEQRGEITAMAPGVARRTHCLDPDGDLPEPPADSPDGWNRFAERVRELVRQRLAELPASAPAAGTA